VNGCFVAESLVALRAHGVKSSVIAADSIYHAKRNSSRQYSAQWVRYPQLPGNFGLSSAGRFLAANIIDKVRQLHARSPIDVIHAHSALPCGHAAALISQRLRIPFVVTVHGLDVFNRCCEHGIAARWRNRQSAEVYEHTRKVICISEKVRQVLIGEMGSVDCEVVYNGTDTRLFHDAKQTTTANTILMVGNLLAGKGHELVLKALARLNISHPGLQCQMIGQGADQERFERLAADLGVSDRTHFLGRRSRTEVAEAMRNCTVFALPSRYEGLGCVYLEAMACGRPVIACRGQGIDEIIDHGNNGWLIPVDGLDELVQALQVLLGNTEMRAHIGAAARKTIVKNLALSHQAERLLKIYEAAAQ
jgi:teichuronic acid biosynthesis glycosyltransferase TuaC